MSARRRIRCAVPALLALALAACASDGPDAPERAGADGNAVRVRLETWGGFAADRLAPPPARVALLVDATAPMARRTAGGLSRIRAARAAARRFVAGVPDQGLEVSVLGGDPRAACGTPPTPLAGEGEPLLDALGGLRARGEGSLADALAALPGPAEGGFSRVVAVSALDDPCEGDLCAAAESLAARGIRLELVALGELPVPACLGDGPRLAAAAAPRAETPDAPVRFHVESAGADPAILVCGRSGGLPVQIAPGPAEVVVELDPPLRVPRSFVGGTRWVLQILDFPGLDPPERHWRWQAEAPPAAEDGAPAP